MNAGAPAGAQTGPIAEPVAYLGFYDMPPVQPANDAYWSAIRVRLGHGPETMVRPGDLWPVWRAPGLVLAQTCSLPYRRHLHEDVTLVGTPDFGLPGCPPGHYRSAMVARCGEGLHSGTRMAINDVHSQSGWGNPSAWLAAHDISPGEVIETGGHAQSVRALAEGRADMAGIDLLSWTMFEELGLLPEGLEIVALTEPSLGTPYITARGNDPEPIAAAIRAAIGDLPAEIRSALHLKGFVQHGRDAYLAEAMPPEPTVRVA